MVPRRPLGGSCPSLTTDGWVITLVIALKESEALPPSKPLNSACSWFPIQTRPPVAAAFWVPGGNSGGRGSRYREEKSARPANVYWALLGARSWGWGAGGAPPPEDRSLGWAGAQGIHTDSSRAGSATAGQWAQGCEPGGMHGRARPQGTWMPPVSQRRATRPVGAQLRT